MHFLLDESVPVVLLSSLRSLGHQAEHVIQIGLAGADPVIFAWCQEHQAILVTPDLDFSDERAYPPVAHHGVIVLRMGHGIKPVAMATRFSERLKGLDEADVIGNIVIMEPDRARIRRKPA